MRGAEAILIFALAVSLGGCASRKPQTAKAAPVPPKPALPAPPPPPPAPLSIPQTSVELPAPQPITPEALATTIPPDQPPAPPPAVRTTTNRTTPPRGGTTPVRVPEPAAPVVAPPPAPEQEPTRQPISEVTPPAELDRLREEARANLQEVQQLIRRIPRGRLRQQQSNVDRINTFVKQAEEAELRRDMKQASELAGRALVLARELK
jgi:hypothetical protein